MQTIKSSRVKSKRHNQKQVRHAPKLVLSTREAAEILGFGQGAVREMVYTGIIKTLPGRNIRIPLIQIEQYIAANTSVWIKK